MKSIYKYLIPALAVCGAVASCDRYDAADHKFDNFVYFDVSQTDDVLQIMFTKDVSEVDKSFSVMLAYPEEQDVSIGLNVDPSLVASYNARFGTEYAMLDQKYYSISEKNLTIPAGKAVSDGVVLELRGLTGQGEDQVGALTIDEPYLIPVRITSSSVATLDPSARIFYVVKRSSAITTAARLGVDNWLGFPTLDVYSENSMAWNNLRAFTYEAFIFIDEFRMEPSPITTLMGEEEYALLRIGDVGFERKQLQFEGKDIGIKDKIPEADPAKSLVEKRWYHVACTHDQIRRTVQILVNGQVQSEAEEIGPVSQVQNNYIHLARRALYDLWLNEADPVAKALYESADYKYNGMDDARQFLVGYSYNEDRPLNGMIAELRVWSVARTPEQIRENMYGIEDPESDPTLLGYWKFDEGEGNVIIDYSRYKNDGVSAVDIVWPDGIEIPILNQ